MIRARGVVPMVVLLTLVSCKLFKKEEPVPEAPDAAAAAETPSEDAGTAATPEPAATEPSAATQPGVVAPSTTVTPSTTKKDAGPVDAGATAPEAGAPADAGGAKSAACQSKCQGILQACLTPGKTEGGLPTFADPTKCKAAFDECAAACK